MGNPSIEVFEVADGFDVDGTELLLAGEDRIIVKADSNKIAGMPLWRKLFHVVFAPLDTCGSFVLEGMQDMLEALSTGKSQVNGITVIQPSSSVRKRDFSYQCLPGKEHIGRFV